MSDAFSFRDYPLASHTVPRTGMAPKVPRRLQHILSLDDFETAARRFLPKPIFAYISGGCETDRTLRHNREAFEAYDWITRVFTDTSRRTRGAPILSSNVLRDFGARDHLSWEHLKLIRDTWPGKLVVKGILHADDARRACELGADGVIVSNHGGRQLDGACASVRALPRVVEAVGERCTVMVDGGFRRGNDVLIAHALGARAVFVGRPFNYAGAVAGEPGILHAIAILANEMLRNMALLGVSALSDLTGTLCGSLGNPTRQIG